VDEQGCPVDSDGDGIPDGIDTCAKTPSGAHVDERGCPSDGDGDGVFDGIDQCPGTERGVKVNPRGCEVAAPFKPQQPQLVLEDVFFGWDAAKLLPESLPVLDKVAESLVAWSDVRVEIQGHTDGTGDEGYNQWLSVQRAEAVRAYLVGKGVGEDRMSVRGLGATQPRADDKTPDGRAANRRVELKKLDP
jgi:OOP family OmpA-OmpF porin